MSSTASYNCKNILASLPRTQRGQPIVLGVDPKGTRFLYTIGNSVVIRHFQNPEISDIYTEHSYPTTVAKFSPSGFYIASADQSGKVRIWDTVNKEHILKNEYQPFVGVVKDLAWSPDSQRIVVVGEGRERFGHVIMADTGTSIGEISGHSKLINSCDFRPTRPYRIATGSEDNSIGIYEGPPFKFKMSKTDHNKYVQVVRYSPDGQKLASADFGGHVFLYDGASADLIHEIGSPAHSGGIYGLAWSPDSKQIITASADKTCKLWNVETNQLVTEFPMGTTIEDQQVSCLWQGQYIISVSLSGFINYLDINNAEKPIKVIKGHNKPITVLAVNDQDRFNAFTASHDGFVTSWNCVTGDNERIAGKGHSNQINGIQVVGDHVYTCGIDDSLRKISLESKQYTDFALKLPSQPKGLTAFNTNILIACINEIVLVDKDRISSKTNINFEPSSIQIHSDHNEFAIGSLSTNKVYIYKTDTNTVTLKKELDHLGPVTDCHYSPNGKYLVACDGHRKVVVYTYPEYKLAHDQEWGFHNAKVNCIAWSPDSSMVASGGLDTNIIIWSLRQPAKHLIMKNAHPQSQITKVAWLDNKTLISVGQDCNTKLWTITPF